MQGPLHLQAGRHAAPQLALQRPLQLEDRDRRRRRVRHGAVGPLAELHRRARERREMVADAELRAHGALLRAHRRHGHHHDGDTRRLHHVVPPRAAQQLGVVQPVPGADTARPASLPPRPAAADGGRLGGPVGPWPPGHPLHLHGGPRHRGLGAGDVLQADLPVRAGELAARARVRLQEDRRRVLRAPLREPRPGVPSGERPRRVAEQLRPHRRHPRSPDGAPPDGGRGLEAAPGQGHGPGRGGPVLRHEHLHRRDPGRGDPREAEEEAGEDRDGRVHGQGRQAEGQGQQGRDEVEGGGRVTRRGGPESGPTSSGLGLRRAA
mmetsp:Transcript_72439/g.212553  ORF Transcript_72439/g.212553 Transcript_72439/m.212553 type:complete len:322 (+) Transcript_72439:337-1302(+)